MEIQTKPIFRSPTPRVKCIASHPSYSDVVVCLYTGEIQIFDPKSLTVKKTANVSNVPIRTAAIVPSKDWILVGNDDGNILVIDLGNLSVIETVKAHDDFIRKIAVDESNQRILTASDDNRTKLWSFSSGFTLINKYKDSKHFVMDVAFFPNDSNHFLTVSLDKRIRMYSVSTNKMIKSYKGHGSGINSVVFINPETFVTGSDDCSVMVWDIRRALPIVILKGHSKNVNSVQILKNGFSSCSEDGTVRIWSKEFKAVEILNLQGRVWDLYMKGNKIIVGSDEELCVFEENSSLVVATLCENRIFYNVGSVLNSTKYDEIGAFKELGALESDFESFKVSPNGKFVGILGNGSITVNSALGMRKRYSDRGKDLFFIDNDRFVYLKDSELVFVNKAEIENTITVEGLIRIIYCDSKHIIVSTTRDSEKCCIYTNDNSFNLLNEIPNSFDKATVIGDNYVFFNDKIHIYNDKFKKIKSFDLHIESYYAADGVLYFSTSNKSFYLLINEENAFIFPIKFHGSIIGVKENFLFYFSAGIKSDVIDINFIRFQRDYFEGIETEVQDDFRDKAISFFELIGFHEKALSLATDENQKFEILIKLGRLEEASKSANSPIKYEKLGKKFLSLGQINKAADCFAKTTDLNSLFLIDLFGDKKYLDFVAKTAKNSGKNNLALLASYKNNDFEACSALLKNTPFGNAFSKFYC